ncbi:MAG: hypothetical protein HEQ16_10535 [Bosea sp.]|jgi:hypothetical protein|nr:hypothetical protein [Bosea sp. (in: a-proteobacteria)]
MMRLVNSRGIATVLAELASRIEADFRRWPDFEKSARLASHSAGFAIEDFSALSYVRDQLTHAGLFTGLDLVADPDDPRDLFGMLLRAA